LNIDFHTTEISGKTSEYRGRNEGAKYGDIDTPTLRDAVDYFHGDGRIGMQVERHTEFVSEGDSVHLHVLPQKDEQCPEDPHGCVMSWGLDEFENMLDSLRVMAKGIEVDSDPETILETMENHVDEYRPSETGNSSDDKEEVLRVDRMENQDQQ
jgi:hypothetical protein